MLAFGLFVAQTSFAQAAETVTQSKTEMISESLELTPEQSAKVETVYASFTEKQAVVQKSSPNAEEVSAKLEELEASFTEEIAAILTPEQFQKWKSMQPQGE